VSSDHYCKYFHALRAIEIRFPVSSDSSHINVAFKWHDSFVDTQTCTQKNIHYEKACVLFCIGALESIRAAELNRDTREGIAEAAKAFAQAAGTILLQPYDNLSYMLLP
jgi:programmed cell death 6-interacting protein